MNQNPETQTSANPEPTASVTARAVGSGDLLGWLGENAAELVAESHAIADTGDFSTTWVCYEHHGYPGGKPKRVPIGYGDTPAQAIRDAMLMLDSPDKWTHVPSLPNTEASQPRI